MPTPQRGQLGSQKQDGLHLGAEVRDDFPKRESYRSTEKANRNCFAERRKTMENNRYVNQLHWVFDLPDAAGLCGEGKDPARIMMIYDRTTDVTRFEVLDKDLPKETREHISLWLRNNTHLRDAIDEAM
jgi:hypothetical protein